MKKMSMFCLICGLLLAVPGFASAQPTPRGPEDPMVGPGPAARPVPPPAPMVREVPPPPAPQPMYREVPPPGPGMVPPPPMAGPSEMPPMEFDRLVQSLRRGGPQMNRVARIRSAANVYWFSCRQVSILMDQLMMEGERVDAACSIQHRVIDPHNFAELHRTLGDPRSHEMLDACWHR